MSLQELTRADGVFDHQYGRPILNNAPMAAYTALLDDAVERIHAKDFGAKVNQDGTITLVEEVDGRYWVEFLDHSGKLIVCRWIEL